MLKSSGSFCLWSWSQSDLVSFRASQSQYDHYPVATAPGSDLFVDNVTRSAYKRTIVKKFLFALLIFLTPIVADAAPLKIVNVGAPGINCIFNLSCSVSVKDTKDNVTLSTGGSGSLITRTFKGSDTSPAAGLFAYEYRLDLRNAVSTSCIDWITLSFGPVVSTLDYGGDKKADQVFVVTTGGVGSIGLASAVQTATTIKFKFKSPVCGGAMAGKGESSFFWGLVSRKPATNVTARLHETRGVTHFVKARAPM
jgi:hypothetical protein